MPESGEAAAEAVGVLADLIDRAARAAAEWNGREQERERVLRSRLVKSGDEVPAPARWLDGELNKAEARGAAAEKARWEARIEKLAAEHDEQAEWYEQRAANEKPTSGRGQRYVKSLREDAESERARAARFRSLLTEEEA